MSTVNIDIEEPVLLLVDHYKANFSHTPVEVVNKGGTSYVKGGYEWDKPVIIPIYGEEGKLRKGQTNLKAVPGGAEVLVYTTGGTYTETDVREDFADLEVRLSTDIYHSYGKFRLWKLYRELLRCAGQVKRSPGGNYHFFKFIDFKDFTNRNAGIYRIVFDLYLVKVSDFIGHD